MVPLDDTTSPSGVTDDLYCFNAAEPGDSYISVSAEADFFTTTDDDTGEGIHHGPKPEAVTLAPGECAKVGDIEGWEWDSGMNFELIIHAGVDIDFESTDRRFRLGYNLKSSGGRKITLPGKLKGYTVNPAGRPIRKATCYQYRAGYLQFAILGGRSIHTTPVLFFAEQARPIRDLKPTKEGAQP